MIPVTGLAFSLQPLDQHLLSQQKKDPKELFVFGETDNNLHCSRAVSPPIYAQRLLVLIADRHNHINTSEMCLSLHLPRINHKCIMFLYLSNQLRNNSDCELNFSSISFSCFFYQHTDLQGSHPTLFFLVPFHSQGGLVLCFQNMQYPPLYQLAQAVPDNILTSLCEMYSFSSSITASSAGSCSHCQVLSPILSRCWFLPQPLPSDGGAGESKPYPSFPIPTAKGSLAAFPGARLMGGVFYRL